MKKPLLIAGFLLAAGSAMAMGPHGKPNPERMMERMTQKLELNESQQAELAKIMEDARAEREDLVARMKAHRERTEEKIAGILTAEQRGRFEEMKAERKKRRAERRERFREQRASRAD